MLKLRIIPGRYTRGGVNEQTGRAAANFQLAELETQTKNWSWTHHFRGYREKSLEVTEFFAARLHNTHPTTCPLAMIPTKNDRSRILKCFCQSCENLFHSLSTRKRDWHSDDSERRTLSDICTLSVRWNSCQASFSCPVSFRMFRATLDRAEEQSYASSRRSNDDCKLDSPEMYLIASLCTRTQRPKFDDRSK